MNTSQGLEFSADTVFLDTVFSSRGSSTYRLKVFNRERRGVNIDRIALGRASSSLYRMNVDGRSGSSIQDLYIPANDSIYIFIEAEIDFEELQQEGQEALYIDSILFEHHAALQDVKILTLVKDQYLYKPFTKYISFSPEGEQLSVPAHMINQNTTWDKDKSHLVYGYVVVESGYELNIKSGSEVFFHENSGIIVKRGAKLVVDGKRVGEYDNPVVFRGDRFEQYYFNAPGQWGGALGGIALEAGAELEMFNGLVMSANIGIYADREAKVFLENVRLFHHSEFGVLSNGGHISADNVIINNCARHDLGLYGGGNYLMRHCTFANYTIGNDNRIFYNPAIYIQQEDLKTSDIHSLDLRMANSLVFGQNQNELEWFFQEEANRNMNFSDCAIKSNQKDDSSYFENIVWLKNSDMVFENPQENDLRLHAEFPGRGKGGSEATAALPFDITGSERPIPSDIGARNYVATESEDN